MDETKKTEEEKPKPKKKWEDEYNNLLKIAQYQKAEFENYKKRERESVQNAFDDGKVFAIRVILPLMDALHEARKTMRDPADLEGFDVLARKFKDGLESLGLIEIPTDGKFDPHVHNAVAVEAREDVAPDTIIDVWAAGYMLGKKVIRPAVVRLSK